MSVVRKLKTFDCAFFVPKIQKGGTMEQPKISVIVDGEIDIGALDEVFFTSLLSRITEIHRDKKPNATTENKTN